MPRCISVTVVACFFFFFLVYVLCVPLAVTYKRIAPQRKVLHAESSRELNRANVSRKRKKPGAGTYIRNRGMCKILTKISNWFSSLCDFYLYIKANFLLNMMECCLYDFFILGNIKKVKLCKKEMIINKLSIRAIYQLLREKMIYLYKANFFFNVECLYVQEILKSVNKLL